MPQRSNMLRLDSWRVDHDTSHTLTSGKTTTRPRYGAQTGGTKPRTVLEHLDEREGRDVDLLSRVHLRSVCIPATAAAL